MNGAENPCILRAPTEEKYEFDECEWIKSALCNKINTGTMFDVGAHKGFVFAPFAELGWTIHAIEPYLPLFNELKKQWSNFSNVNLHSIAIHKEVLNDVSFYNSSESDGINTLHPFLDSHKATHHVCTTTLTNLLKETNCDHIDFLKIDTEGFDLMVLQGFPWDSDKPDVVFCEFEDNKSLNLGYSFSDLAQFLKNLGYQIFVSEWYPIAEYGQPHHWNCLKKYPSKLEDKNSWGNVIAVNSPDLVETMIASAENYLDQLIIIDPLPKDITSEKLILFGASKRGKELHEFAKKKNLEVVAFADSSSEKQKGKFLGKMVVPPEEISNLLYDKIVISSCFERDIYLELLDIGIPKEHIFSARRIQSTSPS